MNTVVTIRLLLLALLVQYAFTIDGDPNDPDELVQCFTGYSCSGYPVVDTYGYQYIQAGECCTGVGKFVLIGDHSSTCYQCLTAGFNVSSLTISGRGTKHAVSVHVTVGDPSTISSLLLQLKVTESDSSRPLSNILDLSNSPIPLSPFGFSSTKLYREFLFEIRDFENRIGLQEDADYTFSLALVSQPSLSAFHFRQREFHLSIVDPDKVYVAFSQSSYIFFENSGIVQVHLQRQGATAKSFTVTVACEELFEPKSVVIPASSANLQNISFSFVVPTDIIFGQRSFVNHTLTIISVSDTRVSIGHPSSALVQIVNNDIVYAGFQQRSYTFSESNSSASVTISLSHPIQQTVQLRLQGGPETQPSTVEISGSSINKIIEFIPGVQLTNTVLLDIIDDNIGLESVEAYVLTLSLVGSNRGVVLGSVSRNVFSTAFVSIIDDENTIVQMQRSTQTVAETDSVVSICATLSNPVLSDVSLTFSTTPITANDPTDYIGGSLIRTIPSRRTSTCATYQIIPDNVIEVDESFIVKVALSVINSDKLSLGTLTSTTVNIIDTNIQPVVPACIKEIDVMFILDSSGSVGQNNFTTMISFVSSVAEKFKFGSEAARFGVVTFSTLASLDISLGAHSDPASFKNAIMTLPYKARKTNTAQALQITRNELRINGRAGVPQIIILFTDGRSDVPADTLSQALLAQGAGIRILTIGIGLKIDRSELNGVSSNPNSENVFLIESFSRSDFASILVPLVRETCDVIIGFSKSTYQVNENGNFIDVSFEVLNGTLNRQISVQFSFTSGTAQVNEDFRGTARLYTLSPSQTKITARFQIINDTIPEQIEFFTALISTEDEFVKVSVPTARVVITDNDAQSCAGQIDLVVVIDSSGSIVPEDFVRVKQFVTGFTSEFQISSNDAHFGVITFSNEANVNIALGSINDPSVFEQTVAQIPFRPGRTNTADAIDLARQQFAQNGRQGVPHAIVVITDGLSNSKDATIQAAVNARAHGIEIFAIGVGSNVDIDELNAVANDPDNIHVFLLSDFSDASLGSILKPLAQKVCEPSCEREIDYMLVLDSSTSVTETNFNVLKEFLVNLVGQYKIGRSAALFGSVRYSSIASTVIPLGSISESNSLQTSLQSISYASGSTNTADAIRVATRQFAINGRSDVPQVMIVFTDGGFDDRAAAKQAALVSQQSGVQIFVVGIGSNVRIEELRDISTSNVHVFIASGFDSHAFGLISSNIVRDTCNVPACSVPPFDIMFALDGSSSVGSSNFRNLLNFVADLTSQYNIERVNGAQFGIVLYSTTAQSVISLPQFQSRAALSNAIINIAFPGGGTSTNLAIKEVRDEFERNGRSQARRVLVIATDGQSNNPSATLSEAQLAKDDNIEIFSIGIGSGANQEELNSIASDPDVSHVLTIRNYTAQSFASITQSLARGICKKPVTCSHEADVIFVLDSSSRVDVFENIKQFVSEVVSEIDVGQSTTRIGIIQYSTRANLVIRLNDVTDSSALIKSISSLVHIPGERNTGNAINLAESEIMADGRIGVSRIIYVITGGGSVNVDSTIEASRIDGVNIVAIGVSSNEFELRNIASDSRLVFVLDNLQLSSLQRIRRNAVDIICTQEPHCTLDIMFLLESSSFVSSTNFQSFLDFMISVVNQYDLSSTRIGIISYSSTVSISSPFGITIGSITSRSQLLQSIRSLQQLQTSGRRTDLALREAYRELKSFQSTNDNVVILLTTGVSDDSSSTLASSDLLHLLENTEVFTVAVSNDNSVEFHEEIFEISTKPSANHAYILRSFQSISGISRSLFTELCDDDSNVRADPMFSVPLISQEENVPWLCYQVYGEDNKHFNLVTDKCISINAHYSEVKTSVRHTNIPLHLIDKLGFTFRDNVSQECVNVVIELDNQNCLIGINGASMVSGYSKGSVHVSPVSSKQVSVRATNCDNQPIVMTVECKRMPPQTAFLELKIDNGLGITPSAHGLIGQFWHAPVKLHKEGIKLRNDNGINKNKFHVVEFLKHGNKTKQVPAILQAHAWGSDEHSCLYAGDSEGGHMYEAKSPSDSLLDGNYKDYITSSLLSTDYKYSKFNDTICMSNFF